jgi:hypothetical protein
VGGGHLFLLQSRGGYPPSLGGGGLRRINTFQRLPCPLWWVLAGGPSECYPVASYWVHRPRWGVSTFSPLKRVTWSWKFLFVFQQFIMWCSIAVCRHAIQTVHTLRLRYALPVTTYQVLEASFWWATTDTRPAASSKTTSPFQVVNAGASHQAAEIAMSIPRLPLERSPNQNPPQRVGQLPEGIKPL